MKLSELGFRQGPFQRTESEKDLKKMENPRPSQFLGSGEAGSDEVHRRHIMEKGSNS